MFSRFFTVLPIAALVAVAAAAPNAVEARDGPMTSCSGGDVYCCNQKFTTPTVFSGLLTGLLTAIVGANVPVGLACNPITVIGVGNGAQCTSQQACCTNVVTNGLVNVVCDPINVNV